MAIGPKGMHFTGTIGMINYYESEGRTYPRIKSSLTRKRVLKEKEFEDKKVCCRSGQGISSKKCNKQFRSIFCIF